MTINAETKNVNTSSSIVEEGVLTGDIKPISYGESGHLTPYKFSLVKTSGSQKREGKPDIVWVSHELNLIALSRNGFEFHAKFGYPNAARMHPQDYGHGFGGYMDEAPIEILKAVEVATNENLTGLTRVAK